MYYIFQGVARIKAEATRIGEIQREKGMDMPVEDFVDQFRFGLTQVVYEWARGMVSPQREWYWENEGIVFKLLHDMWCIATKQGTTYSQFYFEIWTIEVSV